MKVLITGGAGFLGQRLARELLERRTLKGHDGQRQPISELVLLDAMRAADFGDPRVRVEVDDIADRSVLGRLIDDKTEVIFHLAAVVSGEAEADFDLGMRVNLDGSRLVLEACRSAGIRPRVLFTSSVAVYGGRLPELVSDSTPLNPQSSYGVEKAIAELLLADYTRKGFVDGRVARLPTISVRPGRPNQAASSFASGIIREPLHREPAICPVAPETRLWLLSPRRAIECLVALHDLRGDALGANRNVNLPGVSVSVAQMIETLRVVGGRESVECVRWERNPVVERIVGSWPAAWDTARATSLGLSADASFEAIVRAYVEDDMR